MIAVIFGVIGFFINIVLSPYTVMMLWDWFVTPLGADPINIFHAYGLGLFLALFHAQSMIIREKSDKTKEYSVGEKLSMSIAVNLTLLAVGYIVHSLM